MQLAHQKMLPEVLAAVVRAMSAVRSLAAFEQGALGPSKDCAYEGPVMKAITGWPISMEGKSASCAHFSPLGNIAAAMCDLWSNESVQNVRLLSGNAPEAFTELLAYDCRLMNAAAAAEGGALAAARLDDRVRRVAEPAGGSTFARGDHPHCRAYCRRGHSLSADDRRGPCGRCEFSRMALPQRSCAFRARSSSGWTRIEAALDAIARRRSCARSRTRRAIRQPLR